MYCSVMNTHLNRTRAADSKVKKKNKKKTKTKTLSSQVVIESTISVNSNLPNIDAIENR